MHWFAPRSSGAYTAEACARLRTADVGYSPDRHDQLDSAAAQSLAQRIGIVATIGNTRSGFLPWTAFGARDSDLGQRGFRKRNFTRRGTFQPNSQWKAFTVDQYHPLRALAPLGFPDGSAPFFAGAKLPSRKASSHFNSPSWSPVGSLSQRWKQSPHEFPLLIRQQLLSILHDRSSTLNLPHR
jgi:hypothetical protein